MTVPPPVRRRSWHCAWYSIRRELGLSRWGGLESDGCWTHERRSMMCCSSCFVFYPLICCFTIQLVDAKFWFHRGLAGLAATGASSSILDGAVLGTVEGNDGTVVFFSVLATVASPRFEHDRFHLDPDICDLHLQDWTSSHVISGRAFGQEFDRNRVESFDGVHVLSIPYQ